ncbi:phosphatase PAP2 family protein [Amycolatopsis rhabdoformis]|uniref:Phosphatase PAP2 family protein n=1 Tax=Amycolatopsis rhabdoformis TaxID=1448059 RepID=A0ABZ1IA13_9PSEU|nr:phosphatase PAP2 family protein [Amycolatopsis rhabdoformis]WSE31042.1 phosphatase PAP2 family protein [Amycolatopsis rhabdoformis]
MSRILALVAVLCVVATVALGLVYAGGHSPGALDSWAEHAISGLGRTTLDVLVLPTEPFVLIPAIAIIAGVCAYRRRWPDAALAVAGPALALGLNTWVLKPLFDRWKEGILVYPSGHTVSLVTVLVVLVLLARPKVLTVVVGVVLLCCAAIGMIGLGYHYLTDIVGGAFFATAVVTGLRAVTPRRVPAPSAG